LKEIFLLEYWKTRLRAFKNPEINRNNMKKKGGDWLLGLFFVTVVIALAMSYLGTSSCPKSCDDGNPCTADICSAETQNKCTHTALDGEVGSCSGEENGCLAKQCSVGACVENKVRACEYEIACKIPELISPPYEYYKLAKGAPALRCIITNVDNISGKIELSAQLEGYSKAGRQTTVIAPGETQEVGVALVYVDEFYQIEESKFAIMNAEVKNSNETIYSDSKTVQLQKATVYSPPEGEEELIAAWVTYNDPCIEEFISEAKKFSPNGEFRAYQGSDADIKEELAAVFYALRSENITYVTSVFSTTDSGGAAYNQDIRLPYQSLKYKQMNCVEGAVLYSAILEKLEYETAVAFIPGHAFVLVRSKSGGGWGTFFFGNFLEDWDGEWIAIETTDTGDESVTFEGAVREGAGYLNGQTDIIDVHGAIESGVVPMPVGEHECNIADLTAQAEEYKKGKNP
jgi:hypothetical protein